MEVIKKDKIARILGIYTRLMDGELINKSEEAQNYGVNERSIQRDIDDIRSFLENDTVNSGFKNSVIYDRSNKGYRLERIDKIKLSKGEVLAICKILLDSRAFRKEEMLSVLDKLVSCCLPESNKKIVNSLIKNEEFHYVEPRHKTDFLENLWNIGQSILESKYIEIAYERMKDKKIVNRKIKPVAIMFSEYYFYLTAFIDDPDLNKHFDVINDSFPTIYRVDRIKNLEILDERFHIPYTSRFQEGEFRKRVQFMYGGKLQKVIFKYLGNDIDSILDRLPTAVIKSKDREGVTIEAEVFGKGIDMWLKSQGELVKIL